MLAEHAAVSRASITEALDKLEARHYVRRIRDDADRRVTYVRIDPARNTAARQLVVAGALHATDVEIVSGLEDGDQVIRNVPHTLFEGARLSLASTP